MSEKVLFIAPLGPGYPLTVIPSVLEQTHPDWELVVIHDGPEGPDTPFQEFYRYLDERRRIHFRETMHRANDFGHTPRTFALDHLSGAADFVVLTGSDNYYLPRFCEYLLEAFAPGIEAVYCDFVTRFGEDGLPPGHDQARTARWQMMTAGLERGRIDCGAVMVRAEAARAVGWKSREYAADWHFIEALMEKYGRGAFRKVDQVLYVHN